MRLKLFILLLFVFISSCDNTSNNQTLPPVTKVSEQSVSQKIIPIVMPTVECINLKYSYPFNPKYILTLDLSEETKVKISIFDMNEKLIRELVNQIVPVGHNSIFWDGKDFKGELVIDDVYIHICKLET